MKFFKDHWILSLLFLVGVTALAARTGDDIFQIGKPGSTDDKKVVFDVGDGATNPAIVIDTTDKDFDFNKAMNIAGDILTLGDGTNSDKDVVFDIGAGANNPRFRWNSTNSILEFSLDGSSFKKIGSGAGGGGGGTNALSESNFDFETGTPPDDWTASGGTFVVADSGAQLFGEQSGSWDADSLGQTLDSALVPITEGYLGRSCQAEIEYRYASGSAGDYKLVARQFDDSGATEITVAEIDLEVTGSSDSKKAQLFFDCPDDVADDLKLRVESGVADPGVVILDNAFHGTGRNSFQLSQTELLVSARYTATVGCIWSNSGISYDEPAATGACPAITVTSSSLAIDTADDNLPTLVLDENLKPGKYQLKATFQANNSSGSATAAYRLAETVAGIGNADHNCGVESATSNDHSQVSCEFVFELSTATSLSPRFVVQSLATSGNANIFNENEGQVLYWELVKYPLSSAEAITLETSGEYFKASINSADFGLTQSTTNGVPTSGSGTLTIDPLSGPIEITCSGGEVPSGTTCSSQPESIGVAITAKSKGRYKVCTNFTVQQRQGAPNDSITQFAFRLSHRNPALTTEIKQGVNSSGQELKYPSIGTGPQMSGGHEICETFDLNVGKNAFVLEYDAFAIGGSGLQAANILSASSSFSVGFEIIKEGTQKPTPVFTDLTDSLNLKVEGQESGTVIYGARIVNNGASCVAQSGGGEPDPSVWIDSISRPGTGVCSITPLAGAFSGNVICSVDPYSSSNDTCIFANSPSNTAINTQCLNNTGNVSDVDHLVLCYGLK